MEIISSVQGIKDYVKYLHSNKERISLIPTMGNLHDGHISLMDKSKKILSKKIVSIFINPLQFNDKKDFASYPKNIEEDIRILKENKIDCLFMPDEEILSNLDYKVILPHGFLSHLCGLYRPGHFEGVYKIVNKLFDIICPDFVYFGKKDYQQLLLIKFIIKTRKLKLKLIECETIRESSGLPLSSRNNLLNNNQKELASKKISEIKNFWINNYSLHTKNLDKKFFDEGEFTIEYLEEWDTLLLHASHDLNLEDSESMFDEKRVFLGAYVKNVRLIDNFKIE